MTICASFHSLTTGQVIVHATAPDSLAAIDRAYTRLMRLPQRPPVKLFVTKVSED